MTRIRHGNVAMRFKLETTEGVDAVPDATNAFPFEVDSVEYNGPFRTEASQEANGSLAAAAPLTIGQAVEITFRARIKGAGAGSTYSSSIRPPHHDLLQACGWRGFFSAAVAATALAAGTTTSATLATPYAATAQLYRGMPLVLAGGSSGGRTAHITDYTAGRVATLTDLFGTALAVAVTAALPANWTYAATSPADATARAADHPSGTLYIFEDGVLRRFAGLRGMVDLAGETARPGFMTFRFTGTYLGKSDVARPSDTIAQHTAPTLAMGSGGVNTSVLLNRLALPIRNWALGTNQTLEVNDDPNTPFGFGAADISRRAAMLTLDPIDTLVSARNVIADIEAGTRYSAVIRCGSAAGNRWSLTTPLLQPADPTPGRRGIYRTEELSLYALNSGLDPQTRDSDAVLCFY
jgi:hypothetical protein